MRTQCRVCGKFTSHNDYCPEHGEEYPDCEHFECPASNVDFNVCYPNSPHSCKRARAEGECLGYKKGEKKHKRHGIVNTKTGELIATGNSGMELMKAFSETEIYKEILKKEGK